MKNHEKQIYDLRLEIVNKEKYQRRLHEAQTEYNKLLHKKETLENQLQKEKKDVKRLESISLTNLWFSLIGRKEEKLNKEKAEFTEVDYQYKNVCSSILYIKEEISDYQRKLDNIKDLEIKLSNLLKQKEAILIEENNEKSLKLQNFNNNIFDLEKKVKN